MFEQIRNVSPWIERLGGPGSGRFALELTQAGS
jgi:hypothetical protein